MEYKQYLSQVHWNGNQLVAIDCETTGLDPALDEIWQIAMIPLDSNIEIRRDVTPFYINIRPEAPERIDWNVNVMKHNKDKILKAIATGFDKEAAINLFLNWYDKLNLTMNRWQSAQNKIMPLGHNYVFDKYFLMNWLGGALYEDKFHYHYKDTMVVAEYLNDWYSMKAEKVPFSKTNLRWVAKRLGVTLEERDAHDALEDARTTAEVYQKLLNFRLGQLI